MQKKSALFIVLPEEDLTKYFMVSLMIQQLYREILAVADENGGKLENRVMFYCDELGTLPAIESLELIFSASRSRRLSISTNHRKGSEYRGHSCTPQKRRMGRYNPATDFEKRALLRRCNTAKILCNRPDQ